MTYDGALGQAVLFGGIRRPVEHARRHVDVRRDGLAQIGPSDRSDMAMAYDPATS